MNDIILFEDKATDTCKGHMYSYNENIYVGSHGEIVEKKTFRPLKRKSCKGCEHCGGIADMLDAELGEGLMVPYPKNLNHGDYVMLIAINDGRGFEDLYDGWHLEFSKVKK